MRTGPANMQPKNSNRVGRSSPRLSFACGNRQMSQRHMGKFAINVNHTINIPVERVLA